MTIYALNVKNPQVLIDSITKLLKSKNADIHWQFYNNVDEMFHTASNFPQQGSFSMIKHLDYVEFAYHSGKDEHKGSSAILHGRFVELLLGHFRSEFTKIEVR